MQNHTSSKKVNLGIINIPGMIIYNIIISPAVRKEKGLFGIVLFVHNLWYVRSM